MIIKPKSLSAVYNLATLHLHTAQVQGAQAPVVGTVWVVSLHMQVRYSWFVQLDICGCVLVLHTSCTGRHCRMHSTGDANTCMSQ